MMSNKKNTSLYLEFIGLVETTKKFYPNLEIGEKKYPIVSYLLYCFNIQSFV